LEGNIGYQLLGSQNTVAATPLPPAWTMMLLGLAGFGAFAYRRKNYPRLTPPSFDLFACLYWRWRFGSASSRKRRATDLVYAIIPNGVSGPEIHVQ
jgi:hypothetical protein